MHSVLRISKSYKKIKFQSRTIKSSTTAGVFVKLSYNELRPGQVKRLLTDVVILYKDGKKKEVSNFIANVEFFKHYSQQHWYPAPFEGWGNDVDS